PACGSGLAYGAHAGTIAGECVATDGGSGQADDGVVTSSITSTTSGGSDATSSSSSSPPGDSTLAVDEGSSAEASLGPETTATTLSSTSTDGGDTSASTEGSSTGASPFQVAWVADLALCAYPDNVDPAPA